MGPGASHPTCAEPRGEQVAGEPGRDCPSASHSAVPERNTCRLAMAAPRVEENGDRIQLMRRFCSGGEPRQNAEWAKLLDWRSNQPGGIPAAIVPDEAHNFDASTPRLKALLTANRLVIPMF